MLSEVEKAYIAGFLDGDGCIMFQLIRRKDYIYGFQVRASIVFYQKTSHRSILEWLKRKLISGYIRNRKDGMSEYTIVGMKPVYEVISKLKPYIILKRPQVKLAFKIFRQLPKRYTPNSLFEIGKLVDQFGQLNYSKRRTNTVDKLLDHFTESISHDSP